jgi:hypothetical protein
MGKLGEAGRGRNVHCVAEAAGGKSGMELWEQAVRITHSDVGWQV